MGQTVDAITLILNCLPSDEFLMWTHYKNIYKIIQLGLGSSKKQLIFQSAQVLSKIANQGDWDCIFTIYEHANGIMSNLITQSSKFINDNIQVKILTDAIIDLLYTYDSCLIDYARMGLGLLSAEMIVSNQDVNIEGGLKILQILTQVASTAMSQYLLEDRQINETGIWINMAKIKYFINIEINKLENYIIKQILIFYLMVDINKLLVFLIKLDQIKDKIYLIFQIKLQNNNNVKILFLIYQVVSIVQFFMQENRRKIIVDIILFY